MFRTQIFEVEAIMKQEERLRVESELKFWRANFQRFIDAGAMRARSIEIKFSPMDFASIISLLAGLEKLLAEEVSS